MKKTFFHEFRGWRKRRVFIYAFLIAISYYEIGRLSWVIEVAKKVPFFWKCFVFFILFLSIWYSSWRIQRRVLDSSLPLVSSAWIFRDGIIAFAFAIVSADMRVFFDVCTGLIILFFSHRSVI
jgi:hypothetical protein